MKQNVNNNITTITPTMVSKGSTVNMYRISKSVTVNIVRVNGNYSKAINQK
jgi:hypothetical protein